ncbi:putative spermidine/putrescine transport system permease protein [Aeromonas sp. RU39B]|jgi:putative spermidine/putrescine transport system permease protein|uniref:ABC transporter permease n=1 Tax=Aeromonas sp. RU39B TaxID=1907416 RepID=UPI000956F753|nr:ABC transporter permease subunit [Aeromonas sp. RU39B]SIQ03090.1 putative spermidine/putrescine transport system permease protein [Aeromonas sp. RU39B]
MVNSPRWARVSLVLLTLILLLPLLATLLYSLATRWGATMLPDDLTLAWYLKLWSDPRFLAAFGRSLLICFGTLALGTLVLVPLVLVIFYYAPRLDPWMNLLILIPFAVPPVVSSVGLLQIYADTLIGTPWILIGTWFTIMLPFMYRALANNLQAIPLRDLMDAAHLLGASSTQAFIKVVLPNLRKGLLSALFLSFSFLLGEFVFANILVGTRYETLQVYLYNMRTTSGHFTSALVMSYFLLTLVLTWAANRFSR